MKHKMNGWKVAYMSTKKKEPREGAPMRKIDPNTATLDDCRVRDGPFCSRLRWSGPFWRTERHRLGGL